MKMIFMRSTGSFELNEIKIFVDMIVNIIPSTVDSIRLINDEPALNAQHIFL